MSQACAMWRGDIGAYIVGALDRAGCARVLGHLEACAGCRADYHDLLPVRDWLTRLAPHGGTSASHQPGAPRPGTVRPLRRRTRWRLLGGTLAAAGTATAVLVGISGGPAAPTFRSFDRATGVHGLVRLTGTPSGTQIDLSVVGLPPGERCALVAVSAMSADAAGSWIVTYDGTAQMEGTTAIPVKQLTALRIESPAHQLLLNIPVTEADGIGR
jgi:hypothetical protein